MMGNANLADEHDVETKGIAGENGEMAVTDVATAGSVGSENDSMSII